MEGFKGWDILSLLLFFFLSTIHTSPVDRIAINNLWKIKAPPRVVIFGWLAIWKRILTLDNLRRRGRILVNGCPMCLCEEESVDHLMVN